MKKDDVETFEVVVIGGGPAGSTAAGLLAMRGRRVALLERERFPRFHIGESLMPEVYGPLSRLGMIKRLEESEFIRKHSVQFISESGKASRPFYFSEYNPHPSSITWQVERSEFDKMLLERARECGADVREGWSVREVLFDGAAGRERALGVEAAPVEAPAAERAGSNGEPVVRKILAKVTIDASGQSALIARRLGLLRKDPKLVKGAVFAHYEGALRDPGRDEGATLVVHTPRNRGWFWYIPLSRNRVSVGVVGSSEELLKGRGTPEKVLEDEIEASVEMRRRCKTARRVSPVRVLRDFSYRSDRCAGEGWLLIGDAFGFLDPIYSSGVFLALKSAELASDVVEEALAAGDLSQARLSAYGPDLARGMEAIRKLVYAYYTPNFSFAQFVHEHPEHRKGLVDILVGDVFKEGVEEIFEDMVRYCDLPQPRPLQGAGGAAPKTP